MLVTQSKKLSTKINEIARKFTDHDHDKYIIAQGFNKLTSENFTARLGQEDFANKNDIGNLIFNIKNNIGKIDFHDEQKKKKKNQPKIC